MKQAYTGQKMLNNLSPLVTECFDLEGELIKYSSAKSIEEQKIFDDIITKIQASPFMRWLVKQENYKQAKKILIKHKIISLGMAFPKNDFLASFEHLCLIHFDFMIHLSSNNNTQYFLKTRRKKLEGAKHHFRKSTQLMYPQNDAPESFKKSIELIDKELQSIKDVKYKNKPDLLRTLMTDNFMSNLVTLLNYRLNEINQTLLADITALITSLVFENPMNREYLIKKAKSILNQEINNKEKACV